MKKKIVLGTVLGIILLAVLLVIRLIRIDNSQKVDFADEEMGRIISLVAMLENVEDFQYYEEGGLDNEKNYKKIRIDDLDKVTELNIGYTGYYDTLVDIGKCQNLKRLIIGHPAIGVSPYYLFHGTCEMPAPESRERIIQIQGELEEIIRKCPQLDFLFIRNNEDTCKLENLDFLKYADNLVSLWLEEQEDIDYSPIMECKNLKVLSLDECDISDLGEISRLENLTTLDLYNTNIAEAGDIVNLKNLKRLSIKGTPLAENEEELQLLYEAFPDIEIEK